MDKFSSARHGVTRLPPGFRFQPTDEEIIFQYLKCKVFSLPLPASIISEINVCNYDPWDLPGWCDYSFHTLFFSASKVHACKLIFSLTTNKKLVKNDGRLLYS